MSRLERVNEILENMTAFNKEEYQREEVLAELLELQRDLVNATFSEEHAERGTLRIWDVEKHLERLNEERGHVADVELEAFEEKCKFICNLIKAEFSGRNGEDKAFRALDVVYGKKHIIKNCEMTCDAERTEMDAVVVTPKGIFIVEVKNTSKDVMIDEKGDYYRTGTYMNWDSNIGEKMNAKQRMLRGALEKAGFNKEIKIENIVVFTTSTRIEVICKYDYIRTCFLSSLPHVINNYRGYSIYTDDDMEDIVNAIESERCKEAYPMEMDMAQFKLDFAELMATLEQAKDERAEEKRETELCGKVKAKSPEEHYEIKINKKTVKKVTAAASLVALAVTGIMVARSIVKNK